jgi:hypothetical protein
MEEVIKEFGRDKDESKFLQRCKEMNADYQLLEENDKRRIHRIFRAGNVHADVYYFFRIREVSIHWFMG